MMFPPSDIVPFIPNEGVYVRHQRRLSQAVAGKSSLEDWCVAKGLELTVSGLEDHDIEYVIKGGHCYVKWRPLVGQVSLCCDVVSQPVRHGKCYDYKQFIELSEWWYQGTNKGFLEGLRASRDRELVAHEGCA